MKLMFAAGGYFGMLLEQPWSNELSKNCLDTAKPLKRLAHPRGFEPLTSAFGGQRSIQLSYGCLWLTDVALASVIRACAAAAKPFAWPFDQPCARP